MDLLEIQEVPMATDAELLALIGRAPSQQKITAKAEDLLPDLDWTSFLSPAAQREIRGAAAEKVPFQAAGLPEQGPFFSVDPTSNNPFEDFSFSFQEDEVTDQVFEEELAEPPPPPPVPNMGSFPLESLWSQDPTDEAEDALPRRAPLGGLEALFMNGEARDAQEAMSLAGVAPLAIPQGLDLQFDSAGDFDFTPPRRMGGGSPEGVVVGRRGSDGRFRAIPQERPSRASFETARVAVQRETIAPRGAPTKAAPSASIANYRTRMSYLNDD